MPAVEEGPKGVSQRASSLQGLFLPQLSEQSGVWHLEAPLCLGTC